jgi:hypothetical protein
MIIDYSQYSLWNFCPWAWYERYVNQRQLRYEGQRSDALALGSLVHNGLDNFAKFHKPIIDQATMTEMNPTPECYAMAVLLIEGYINRYPAELWPVELTEQPLRFPLRPTEIGWDGEKIKYEGVPEYNGLAKLDGYFYVPEDTTIESGCGPNITLSRGWWGKEYKTKSFGRKRAEWIKEWQTKRQADFQILALKNLVNSREFSPKIIQLMEQHGNSTSEVQGILVCVLEKPHEYVPKRKCAGCKETWEMSSFIPQSEGFMCPSCNCVQELSPYIPKSPKVPEYFRITVTRDARQLEIAKHEILRTANRMEAVRANGMEAEIPNRDACVNNVHRRECEYHAPHTYGGTTSDGTKYVQIDSTKYMGLAEVGV